MKLRDDALRGRVVLSSDGLAVGEVEHLLIDTASWRVSSFEVQLRRDIAERLGFSRGLFHGPTFEVSTDVVQSIGDAVILSVTADMLHPTEPPIEQAAAPS